MRRALSIGALVALALVLAAGRPCEIARAQERGPNVVLIVADDLGWGDLGAYGQPRIRTPRIDRLAREGMRFVSAYAGAPVCAPSRCVLLTGLASAQCPVRENVYPNQTLRVDEVTIAHLLRGAGYRTSIVGKWGLGGELADGTAYQPQTGPWAMGFDSSLVVLDQGVARHHWPEWLWIDGERFPLDGNVEDGHARYAPDVFRADALRQIERAAERGEAFFLYFASTLPHRELRVEGAGPYASEPWPEIERAYASMVSRFDEDVGAIVDRVDALGLGERTLVLVSSDNGPASVDGHRAAFFASSGPFRGGKRDLFEGGIRVPLIARWTGVVPAGVVEETPVGLVDLTPTLAELAGIGAPAGIDGRSIAPRLRRGSARPGGPGRERTLCWTSEESGAGEGEDPSRRALRRGDLKLIERADGSLELYDLVRDPGETRDLAGERPDEVAALSSELDAATRGVTPRVDPIVRASGPGVRDSFEDAAMRASDARPVLWLRMGDGDGAITGAAVARVTSALRAPAMIAATAAAPRGDAAVLAGASAGAPNERSLRFVRAERQHLVVPPHAALSMGATSFTVEAWVKLASLEGPQWLVVSREAHRDERFVDFGVLARSSGLPAAIATTGAAGAGIALVFGDRRPRGGAWALVSSLSIEDGSWHRVVVRVDVERGVARFDLDDAHEELSLPVRAHVLGGGPLYVGAHPGAEGAIDGALDGWIDELRISRGVVAADALLDAGVSPERGAIAVLDLGRVALGAAPIVRTVRVDDAALSLSRAMEGDFDVRGVSDARLVVEGAPFRGVSAGAGGGTLRVTLRPTSPGRLRGQHVIVDARVERLGHAARRGPLTLRIEGAVLAPPAHAARGCSIGSAGGRGGERGLVLLVLLAVLLARGAGMQRRGATRGPAAVPRSALASAAVPRSALASAGASAEGTGPGARAGAWILRGGRRWRRRSGGWRCSAPA